MRRALPWLVAALGTALVVAGIAVFWWTNTRPPTGSGPVAYAPLEPGDPAAPGAPALSLADGSVVWDTGHLVGVCLVLDGTLVLADVGGWALGRRSARRGAA